MVPGKDSMIPACEPLTSLQKPEIAIGAATWICGEDMSTATATIVDLAAYRERKARQRVAPAGSLWPGAGMYFVMMPVPMVSMWPVFYPVAFAAEMRE